MGLEEKVKQLVIRVHHRAGSVHHSLGFPGSERLILHWPVSWFAGSLMDPPMPEGAYLSLGLPICLYKASGALQ